MDILTNRLNMVSDRNYLLFAGFWTILTLWLSLISARAVSQINVWDFVGFDKLAHLTFYAVFAFAWLMGLRKPKISRTYILIFSIVFGIAMEFGQYFLFLGRSFEINDMVANIVGCVIGLLFFRKCANSAIQ